MTSIKIPSPEEIRVAYRQGEEAVISLFYETIGNLADRIQNLEDQIAKNSSNSGKPPSSDGLKKKPKSLRHHSGKKSGGQPGHTGYTLKAVAHPDRVEVHSVDRCSYCHTYLEGVKVIGIERRQLFDVPQVQIEVTEHRAEIKDCPICHQTNTGKFPFQVSQPVQYGERIKAQMVYFNQQHHVPLKRTTEIIKDLYGQTISEGTIVEACNQVAKRVEPVNQAIKAGLIATKGIAHFDETGERIDKKLWWLHVVCTNMMTYYAVHQNRGCKALDAIGIFPVFKGIAMHDAYRSYFKYQNVINALCNAHHLRELIFIQECYQQSWAFDMYKLLLEIKDAISAAQPERDCLLPFQLADFEARYDAAVIKGFQANPLPKPLEPLPKKRGKPKQHPARNLLDHFKLRKQETLEFMYDFKVPFDNNQAERDIRMVKLKQKISGCFRSDYGAEVFCQIRGYISTSRKNGQCVMDVLILAINGFPFVPPVLQAHFLSG